MSKNNVKVSFKVNYNLSKLLQQFIKDQDYELQSGTTFKELKQNNKNYYDLRDACIDSIIEDIQEDFTEKLIDSFLRTDLHSGFHKAYKQVLSKDNIEEIDTEEEVGKKAKDIFNYYKTVPKPFMDLDRMVEECPHTLLERIKNEILKDEIHNLYKPYDVVINHNSTYDIAKDLKNNLEISDKEFGKLVSKYFLDSETDMYIKFMIDTKFVRKE